MLGNAAKRFVRLFCAVACAAIGAAAAGGTPTGSDGREALLLDIRGAIGPATSEYVSRGLAEAARRKASLVILRIDTPGGLESAMRDIDRDILASSVPVAAYVAPSGARAASAGTYIVYASHVAAMAPGTNIGAATPVGFGGGEHGGTEALKATNDAVAYIRSLADLRGRNAEWAEKAVRHAASLPAAAAKAADVVDIVATDIPALLQEADGRTVLVRDRAVRLDTRGLTVVPLAPNWRTRLLTIVTDPNVAYILLLVGMYGIIFEFFNPGAILPGVTGGIALLIGLFALNLLPTNYAGLGLIGLGLALIVAEAFTTSFVLGIGGVAALAAGSVLLFDTGVPGFGLSLSVVIAATAATALLLFIAVFVALRAQRLRVTTGEGVLAGHVGTVLDWSGEHGWISINGERWRALATAPLLPRQHVRVVGRKGLTLVVEPAPERSIPD